MIIDQINLNELRIFVSVYENLSMTKAGEALGLTQSGVSQHVMHLEDILQTKLFDRHHKKLIPTSSAKELFEACRANLVQIEAALAQLQVGQKKISGKVSLGMPIEFGNNIIMPLLAKFCIEHPEVDLQIRMGFASEMNSLLISGELDFAFVDTYNLDRELESKKIFDEILCLCCTPRYLDSKRRPTTLEDFENLDFIEYQKGNPVLKMWFEQEFGKMPKKLNVRAYVMDVQGVAKLIKNNLGCGVLPLYVVDSLKNRGIPLIVFDDFKNKVHNIISIAQVKNKTFNRASYELQKYLLKEISELKNEREPLPFIGQQLSGVELG